jgi:hypothetical protein
MRKLLIAGAATMLIAGTTGALAEDNANLLQPVAHGVVTGDAERDTVAYDVTAPSDLWVRFSDECIIQGATLTRAAPAETVASSAEWNPHPR